MMVSKSMMLCAFLAASVAMSSAQRCSDANAYDDGYGCHCRNGYACATCSGGLCDTTGAFDDYWGCSNYNTSSSIKQFIGHSYSSANTECIYMNDYCDAPTSQTQSYISFRPNSQCAYKYIGEVCSVGLTQCNSSSYTNNCGGSKYGYGPDCQVDDALAKAFAAWIIIVIVAAVCVCLVIPVSLCFCLGFACFAGGRSAAMTQSVAQPQFSNPNAGVAPPSYDQQQQAPQYPPQDQYPEQYPPHNASTTCANCGSAQPVGSKFCNTCGTQC